MPESSGLQDTVGGSVSHGSLSRCLSLGGGFAYSISHQYRHTTSLGKEAITLCGCLVVGSRSALIEAEAEGTRTLEY